VSLPPFQALLDAHREEVWRLLAASVGSDRADDCFQETVLAALRAYPRLRDASNLRSWLLTIAHRKALDEHRAQRRRPEPVAEVPEVASAPPAEPASDGVWELLHVLPPKQRAAVALRYVVDLRHAEIGRVLGCTEEAARRNVHDGLARLREKGALS
jgi:RNA polymerase sigma factor (sigma-70 family)